MINNVKFCPVCVKRGTCMWEDKLIKLNGTKNNPIYLDITVDKCEEFLLDENIDEENNEEE